MRYFDMIYDEFWSVFVFLNFVCLAEVAMFWNPPNWESPSSFSPQMVVLLFSEGFPHQFAHEFLYWLEVPVTVVLWLFGLIHLGKKKDSFEAPTVLVLRGFMALDI